MTVTDRARDRNDCGRSGQRRSNLKHRPAAGSTTGNPENATQWAKEGKAIASRNLRWSIFADSSGSSSGSCGRSSSSRCPAGLPALDGEIFWLISMPSLVGATLRIPYTFMVPRFGGRNWTIVSAGLLLIRASASPSRCRTPRPRSASCS